MIRPPFGAVVPVLPPDYATIWVGGVPYYYANEIYYTAGAGGFIVANPPAAGTYVEAPGSPPPVQAAPQAAPPAAAPASPSVWYYCAPTKTYYPYVQTCAEAWKTVPASPPPR